MTEYLTGLTAFPEGSIQVAQGATQFGEGTTNVFTKGLHCFYKGYTGVTMDNIVLQVIT